MLIPKSEFKQTPQSEVDLKQCLILSMKVVPHVPPTP